MTRCRPLTIRALVALAVLSIAGLAACTSAAGGSTGPSSVVPPPSTTATAMAEPSATEAPSAAAASEPADASGGPTAVATSIDPCQVLTPDEVATATGSQFGPPTSTTDDNSRTCIYGQEGLDFEVIVVQAPDAATAKAQEPAFKAQLEQAATDAGLPGMQLTELPDFEPGVDAAVLHASTTLAGKEFGGVALYALKGPVLLALTELTQGGTIATDDAMETAAMTALGRIP